MTQHQNTTAISIMHPVCCGLDVHKMKNSACLTTTARQFSQFVIDCCSNLPILFTTLADRDVGLAVTSSKGRILQIIADRQLKPLYACLRLKRFFFRTMK